MEQRWAEKRETMADREKLIELIDKLDVMTIPTENFRHGLADYLIANGVVVRRKGEWEFFVETSFNGEVTEVDCCGWRCSHCKKPLEEVVGGYWDDETSIPTLNFCPNCGAKMDGGI